MHDDDFIAFTRAGRRDPDGASFRGVLEAHIAVERARSLRTLMTHALAGGSLIVWVAAAWPTFLPAPVRAFVLTAWVLVFGGLLLTFLSERRWRQLRQRRLAELEPPAGVTPDEPGG